MRKLYGFNRCFSNAYLINHKETRILPFACKHLHSIIADVSQYYKFVPFCQNSIISDLQGSQEEGKFIADLSIGFMAIRVHYLSHVQYRPGLVRIYKLETDPMFKQLNAVWKLRPLKKYSCELDFDIRFELSNSFYNYTVTLLKNLLVYKMNEAFIEQTKKVYKNHYSNVDINNLHKSAEVEKKLLDNINALYNEKKIRQSEFDAALLMISKKENMIELHTIDTVYGGNKDGQESYVICLRKLLSK